MRRVLLRPTAPTDLEAVAGLWESAFHDPAPLVRALLTAGGLLDRGMAAVLDGTPVSVMFAFPELALGGRSAAYLYALCTRPDLRGQGLGSRVLEALTARCFDGGADLVFLSPADAGLERWYREKLGMAALGGVSDLPLALPAGVPGRCAPVSVADYLRARRGVTGSLLRAQAVLLEAEGGGLFRLTLSAGTALACVQPTPRGLLVLELLCSPETRAEALQTLAAHFSQRALLLRSPGRALPLLYRSRDGKAVTLPPDFCFPFLMN